MLVWLRRGMDKLFFVMACLSAFAIGVFMVGGMSSFLILFVFLVR